MKNCVFAGTFDPFTNGHKKITEICKRLFDKVYVVVGENPDKSPFFPESGVRRSPLPAPAREPFRERRFVF